MASSMMDWTPTNAVVLTGAKRTFDNFSQQPELSQAFNPYAGQYVPGGWPISPGQSPYEVQAESAPSETAINPLPLNIIVQVVKRICLGIASRLPIRKIPQIYQATVTRESNISTGTLSSSIESEIGNQPPFLLPNTPQSSKFSTFLSSNVPSSCLEPATGHQPASVQPETPQSPALSAFLSSYGSSTRDLSGVEEERDEGHMRHANKNLVNEFSRLKATAPRSPMGESFNSPYLRCADWKLLRKLGLTRTSTPPDSPKLRPTNNATTELADKTVDECEASPFTPPATPPAERSVHRPAVEVILRSPYPVLVPSLSRRPLFKFGQTPVPEQSHVNLLPADIPEQSPSLLSEIGDQSSGLVVPPQTSPHERHDLYLPANMPKQTWSQHSEAAHQSSKLIARLQTPQSGSSPSAQLLADMHKLSTRDRSPIVEARTPDPYYKSPSSPLMSGELSAEQQSRYTTRSVAKQKAEAARHLNGYNIIPLSKEWEAKVEYALKHGHGAYAPHDLIKVVPPMGSKTMSQWLNDETINGYLKLVTDLGNKSQTAGATPKYHAFTSFFMTTLLDKGYEGIKRWSKRAKIDGKKLYDVQDVFIPVNRNFHWTMLVVSPKHRIIHYYDSLGGNGREYAAAAMQWLRGELGTVFIEGDWQIENAAASPMQNNSSDCGVFAITTAKQLMLGRSPMAYGAKDIPVQRRRIVAELVAGKLL